MYRRSRFKLIENVRTRIHYLQISEHSPSSYHRRRYKDPQLCCRLAARVLFCQHWPVQLQGYENGYILLGGCRDRCRSSWSLSVRVKRCVGTISLFLSLMAHGFVFGLFASPNKPWSALGKAMVGRISFWSTGVLRKCNWWTSMNINEKRRKNKVQLKY